MQVVQNFEIVNAIKAQGYGDQTFETIDANNLVDWGKTIPETEYENFTHSAIDLVGKQMFVDRIYTPSIKSIMHDSWEYGSILMKLACEPIEAEFNDKWALENRVSYDGNMFYQPKVSVKFYNKKVTYQIPISLAYDQVKSALLSEAGLNQFLSFIQTQILNEISVRTEGLIKFVINTTIAEVLTHGQPFQKRALLTEYKALHTTSKLTAKTALQDADFLRYATEQIQLAQDYATSMSPKLNIGKKQRFTPRNRMNTILLSKFAHDMGIYLKNAQSQYGKEYLNLPEAETVPFWQNPGEAYALEDISKIDVTTKDKHEVNKTGVLGIMFDEYAIMACNESQKTTSQYVAKGDFYNNFHMVDASYFIDTDEQIIVFTLE